MLNSSTRTRRRRSLQTKPTATKNTPAPSVSSQHDPIAIERQMPPARMESRPPSPAWVATNAVLYVLSGVTQPLLMSYAKHAGLADPRCQLYMLFYYVGPASVALSLRCGRRRPGRAREPRPPGAAAHDGERASCAQGERGDVDAYGATADGSASRDAAVERAAGRDAADRDRAWPSRALLGTAAGIAAFDIFAQSMTYTGNNLAGPTIFAIVYSSVTIWAALFSKLFLARSLAPLQWTGICLVVAGLALTAVDSVALGNSVFLGSVLIVVGSAFHGLTYVLSEKIMTVSSPTIMAPSIDQGAMLPSRKYVRHPPELTPISVRANCAVQGIVAVLLLSLWQVFYTFPRRHALILAPMAAAGTSPLRALGILGTIAGANLIHSVTFFATLKHFPGGATSAGVLKGLQAVLVFALSAVVLCGNWGGAEMCWSRSKGLSLVVVVCGILLYGTFAEKVKGSRGDAPRTRLLTRQQKGDYRRVGNDDSIMCV